MCIECLPEDDFIFLGGLLSCLILIDDTAQLSLSLLLAIVVLPQCHYLENAFCPLTQQPPKFLERFRLPARLTGLLVNRKAGEPNGMQHVYCPKPTV
jgi:hypothetical protein